MGRKKKISDINLINLVNDYSALYPDKQIKYSDLSAYAKSRGIDASDVFLRRNECVRQEVERINSASGSKCEVIVAAYKPLDIDKLFIKYPTREGLKGALTETDTYYGSLAAAAGKFIKENENLTNENRSLLSSNKNLKNENEKLKNYKELYKEEKKHREFLESFVKDTVNEETALLLLSKKGIYEHESEFVNVEKLQGSMIKVDTNADSFTSSALNDLAKGFLDDEEE